MDKIKFYSLGSEKLDLFNIKKELEIDTSKLILAAPGFNKAMQKVINKDIKSLNTKLEKTLNEIKQISLKKGVNISINSCYDMSYIKKIIEIIEQTIKTLIIESNKKRVHLFSFNRKKKVNDKKNIDELINYLTNCCSSLVTMKNEYEKLIQRKNKFSMEEEIEKEEEEDPLERTINFYINKKNEI